MSEDFIVAASGATSEQILAQYPQLTSEGLSAAFRYAANVLRADRMWDLQITTSRRSVDACATHGNASG